MHAPAQTVRPVFGSVPFGRVLADLPMTCLDIGARGGFTQDLLPIAWAIDACGFEPDAEECEKLNQRAAADPGPWRSLRYIPAALSEHGGLRTLYLTRHRGSSSLFPGDPEAGAQFGRADYAAVERTVELDTLPLDVAAARYGVDGAVYMKIDIEGAELEAFRSAPNLLSGPLLAIRCEVAFFCFRPTQPLYVDVERCLRDHGFLPMGFIELHHWRRRTRIKHPATVRGAIPYSRGQIAHGDMLFFRDPDRLPSDNPEGVAAVLRAAFLALVYDYVDHAAALLTRPEVAMHLRDRYGFDAEGELGAVSRALLRRYRRRIWKQRWRSAKDALARRLKGAA